MNLKDLSGRQKTAILIMAIGEEASAAITQTLPPDEVEALSFEIASPPADLEGGDSTLGRGVFNASCAICHGADATGTERAPPLAGGLLDADYVASLVPRRDGPRLRNDELVAPSAPKPKVDISLCDADPEDCGSATYLGGGRLWQVVTANSRGDYFHEDVQLYDSETGSFWNPDTKTRQKMPFDDNDPDVAPDLDKLQTSPDGTWALWGDTVLATADAELTDTRIDGLFCGWL